MNNAVNRKTMEILKNGIDVNLLSYKKRFFKMDIETKLYVTQNI